MLVNQCEEVDGKKLMTLNKKWKLISEIEEQNNCNLINILKIICLAMDKDELVRSRLASALVCHDGWFVECILLVLAKDKSSFVRTEAYDSLSVFVNEKVAGFLEKIILKEPNELACSYAIMSWTDVVLELGASLGERNRVLHNILKKNRIQKSEHCMLSCCRAQYLFGDENSIYQMIELLQSTDYRIRCAVIAVFCEITDSKNSKLLWNILQELQVSEKSKAVQDVIRRFLEEFEG